LLLRDCADGNGFEVLMTRRADQGIFANAYVFPAAARKMKMQPQPVMRWRACAPA
jgi:predicted O-linked N-acetylglucosamine transferase (SPINDLY family)